jgi:hypothetical protein
VFRLLEQFPEERAWDAELAFPEAAPEERLRQARAVREWLNKSPLGRRPLVKAGPDAQRPLNAHVPPCLMLPAGLSACAWCALDLQSWPEASTRVDSSTAAGDW